MHDLQLCGRLHDLRFLVRPGHPFALVDVNDTHHALDGLLKS